MGYDLELSQNAKRDLDSLEKTTVIRILKKLREIIIDPYRYVKRLTGSELFSLRIGDYRVLMILNKEKIFVVKIGHRRDVYTDS